MWEKIETLYHATIEAPTKMGKKLVIHNQECKKKIKKKNLNDICIFLVGMKHAYQY